MKTILELLATGEHYGISERVEIAKGKYEYIATWKDAKRKIKRIISYGKEARRRN